MILYIGVENYTQRVTFVSEFEEQAVDWLAAEPRSEFRRIYGVEADEFATKEHSSSLEKL